MDFDVNQYPPKRISEDVNKEAFKKFSFLTTRIEI